MYCTKFRLSLLAQIRLGSSPVMNSKLRNLKRYVLRKDSRVGLRALARRYELAPCTVSRYLNRNKIKLAPRRFPWEDWSNTRGKEQAQKCRRALALFLLGLNRQQ